MSSSIIFSGFKTRRRAEKRRASALRLSWGGGGGLRGLHPQLVCLDGRKRALAAAAAHL